MLEAATNESGSWLEQFAAAIKAATETISSLTGISETWIWAIMGMAGAVSAAWAAFKVWAGYNFIKNIMGKLGFGGGGGDGEDADSKKSNKKGKDGILKRLWNGIKKGFSRVGGQLIKSLPGRILSILGRFLIMPIIKGLMWVGGAIVAAIGGIPLAIIAGIVALGALVYVYWDEIKEAWNKYVPSWEDIANAMPGWMSLDWWTAWWNEMDLSLPTWEDVKGAMPEWLVNTGKWLKDFWDGIDIMGFIKSAAGGYIDTVTDVASGAYNLISGAVSSAADAFSGGDTSNESTTRVQFSPDAEKNIMAHNIASLQAQREMVAFLKAQGELMEKMQGILESQDERLKTANYIATEATYQYTRNVKTTGEVLTQLRKNSNLV